MGPAVGNDPAGVYRADNHMWLFAAPDGRVLHAGPSAAMNWITTQGTGSISSAGNRGTDAYSQSGVAVMYDIGKIVKMGGAPQYDDGTATNSTYVIDMNAGLSVRQVSPMAYPRIFANGVVLPNGHVLVVGGQSLCLLLTLLAVPVFYSLFDDLARSHIWSRIGSAFNGVFGRARRRAATAAASLLGVTSRH